MKRRVVFAATLAALTCGGSLRAHHSDIAIDASTPVWVTGTVVRYEIMNPHVMRPPFVDGFLLVNAAGQRSAWSSYGKMQNCVRAGDDAQSWAQFLNASECARFLWCSYPYRATVPTIPESSALADEINRLLASPCS